MKLKNILPVLALIGLVIAGYIFYTNKKTLGISAVVEVSGNETVIKMGKNSYEPGNIKIKVGTKVTFVNGSEDYRWPASDLHPSHLMFPEFDPKEAIVPGGEWSFTFEKAGEWGFHDHLAPYITGTISVVE